MKKGIRLLTSLVSLISVAVLGLFGIKANAEGETETPSGPVLEWQESLADDKIRYISTIENVIDLSEIIRVDVVLQLSKDGETTKNATESMTKVYTCVKNSDGNTYLKNKIDNTYYAIYTVSDLAKYYYGWTLSARFDYVYAEENKVSTNTVSYKIQPIYVTIPNTWETPTAFMWNESDKTIEANSSFPGVTMVDMKKDVDGKKTYAVSNYVGSYDSIIFSSDGVQTGDLTIVENHTYDLTKQTFRKPNNYGDNVYIYCWKGADDTYKNSVWPGQQMKWLKNDTDGQGIYGLLIDMSFGYDNLKFTNQANSGWETNTASFSGSNNWRIPYNNGNSLETY